MSWNRVAPKTQRQRRKIVAVYLGPSNFKHIGDRHTIADQINEAFAPYDLSSQHPRGAPKNRSGHLRDLRDTRTLRNERGTPTGLCFLKFERTSGRSCSTEH